MGKPKRWLMIVAGVLVALILGVLVAGLLLPEEYGRCRSKVSKRSSGSEFKL